MSNTASQLQNVDEKITQTIEEISLWASLSPTGGVDGGLVQDETHATQTISVGKLPFGTACGISYFEVLLGYDGSINLKQTDPEGTPRVSIPNDADTVLAIKEGILELLQQHLHTQKENSNVQ